MPEHIRGSAQRMVKNKLNNIWDNEINLISLWSKQKEIRYGKYTKSSKV
jgi:hypothetical protein